jgi:2-dehydropantoate 2-reductase
MNKIMVFGTGGVGGYFGGRLAQAGLDVNFIARGRHLAAIQTNGLKIETEADSFTIDPANATSDASSVGVVDVVLVATKAWQVNDAAHALKPVVGEQTVVIPLLNGVEAPEQLARVLGKERVLGGFCRVMSYIKSSGVIHQSGVEPYVAFGEMDDTQTDRVQTLQKLFTNAGIKAEVPASIQEEMWQKFLFIASFSGVGAVTRAPAGIIRSMPETREMLRHAMQEIADVARARDIPLADDAIERAMGYIDNLPVTATASMQRDVLEGRPSELEAQNGAVVRLGKQVGVDTPLHRFIYTSLMPSEMLARGNTPVGL